jgi:hypothetical protein
MTGPLCFLRTVDKLNLTNLKLRTDGNVHNMAVKYLGPDEVGPKMAPPP